MLHPALHFAYMSTLSNQRTRLMKYLIPIITVAAILNVPEYLEFEFVWKESSTEERNYTSRNAYDKHMLCKTVATAFC